MSLDSIWGWVLVGVVVSAFISQSDQNEVINAVGLGPVTSILLALVVLFPFMYVRRLYSDCCFSG